ncbi:ADP-ribosylglycohydrolase family protein [Numidum massiliense]|uniref:ADP-ribosylglycohydrolase family protein n=1 Tax=Numidum massiliense TaxID=1522315 RepID=UPI0006D53C74|nr:ADP-ribosylglycohydrolase family protein [Numidum massiliense]
MIPNNYLETIYAGFLGMNAGIRLGAPVEPPVWTDKRIEQIYGDIRGYVKEYKNFAADDDANGPVFFIRALYDDASDRELEAADVGNAWLNYARHGIGIFWWGGEGVSTEHTAYINLTRGIPAPKSGSAEVNGLVMAEQIGGQIFIDTWGLLFPNNIHKAAEYAEKAASVSHDKNGLYGARFMAACISKAFATHSILEVIEAGLSTIPEDSTYAKVVQAVVDFHQQQPDDFKACRQYLEEEWGYDKYTGVCHIIPNAGVCVLALLYGAGDFARTIEIATMCGWDTDCNAGNVGTIAGVMYGLAHIPDHYRQPINDFIVTSSVSGYLNIVDIPTFCKELALLGYRLSGAEAPAALVNGYKRDDIYFDFELPGSTHGFRTDHSFKTLLRHSDQVGFESTGSLEVLFDRMVETDRSKVFYKPFYRRFDFSDERYKPTFAPKAYCGQTVSADIYLDKWHGEDIILTPYVRDTYTQEDLTSESITLQNKAWQKITFTIPDTDGAVIDEIGYIIQSPSPLTNRALGCLYIDNFHVFGNADYTIDFSKQFEEFKCITPFAHNLGEWSLTGDYMTCVAPKEGCSAYSGNYYAQDASIAANVQPISGESHCLIFRALGIKRHYLVGFDGPGRVSLIKNDFGYERLLTVPFAWEHGKNYYFHIECRGSRFVFSINGQVVLECEDDRFEYGMFGFGCLAEGETNIRHFHIRDL